MKVLKRLSILTVVICLIINAAPWGCKKSSEALTPTGALLQRTDCKQSLSNTSGKLDGFAPGPHEDCIEFQYNGTDTLVLRHINAGFNCCPGEITANIEFNGKLITITESEMEQGCDCLCLFDLDYEIINLTPGEYTIRIIEPYVDISDQVLEFTLQLFSETSGTHCLPRTNYPWM